jgi:RNA 2',3'-cyclic 3'-phosphodiesterase
VSFFLALEIAPHVHAKISKLLQELTPQFDAKWVRPERLHLTLLFMGQLSPEQVSETQRLATDLAAEHRSFFLSLKSAGTFVTERAPTVLWLGVAGDLVALFSLQQTFNAGFHSDGKTYVPHVTLARGKTTGQFDALLMTLESFETEAFEVTQVMLFESRDNTYTPIFRVPLSTSTRAS